MSQVDPKEYHVEEEGTDKEMFVCNTCSNKFKKAAGVKSHITKTHIKKAVEVVAETTADDQNEITEEDLADLNRWDRPRPVDVEPVGEETETETPADDAETNEGGQEDDLGQAVERIKQLEEDMSMKEEVMKKMESDLEKAKDDAKVANVKVDSLEAENAVQKAEVKKYQRIALNQRDDINKMETEGVESETVRKLKEAQAEVKAKTKALEANDKTKKEMAKKVEYEVLARSKAEADCSKFSKMVDILQSKTDTNEKNLKTKVVCRDLGKPGGCPRVGKCTFLHPALAKENKSIDCLHWMNGKCKFIEKICKFKHDPAKKFSSDPKNRNKDARETVKETVQQDFLVGLVRALAQSPAGEARLGSVVEPAGRLEDERSTRPRMVSSNNSAQGMDGQNVESRSYSSVVSGNRSGEGQESSRSYGSGREQELMEQLRGMGKKPQPASQMDHLNEGFQLLMQIAQQQTGAGRR